VPSRTVQLGGVCDVHVRDDAMLPCLMCAHIMSTSRKEVVGHDGCVGAVYGYVCK
jgi:hypothetical protein